MANCDVEPRDLIGTPWFGIDFFNIMAHDCLSKPAKPFWDNNLIDFIHLGEWDRSGVSSFGRVEGLYIDHDDKNYEKKRSFKACKNFFIDIMNSYKLKAKCFSAEAFVENAAIIKSELAKIRMAAASPLPLYLLES